jgi:hypothetical protein
MKGLKEHGEGTEVLFFEYSERFYKLRFLTLLTICRVARTLLYTITKNRCQAAVRNKSVTVGLFK